MKLFIIALTLFSFQTTFAQFWYEVPSGTDSKLNSVHFINKDVGYIVGNDSVMLKTLNSGKTWGRQPVNIAFTGTRDLIDVFFEDEMKGYLLVGPYGGLYKTKDGGLNWELDSAINNTNMCFKRSMEFTDFDSGYLGGSMCFQGESVAKLANGTWSTPNVIGSWNADDQITNFDFLDNQKGYASSSSNYIFKTVDGGTTWDSVASSIDTLGTSDVVYINDTLAFATHSNTGLDGILKSIDGGNTWSRDLDAATFYYPGFNCVTKSIFSTAYFGGFTSGADDGLIFTKPSNSQWVYYPVDHPIHDIIVSHDSTVFAVGDSGLIVTNVDLASLSLDEPNASRYSVYPNPSSGEFRIKGAQQSVVSVYNILGNTVVKKSLLNSDEDLDLSSFADGVYIIQIETESSSELIKVVKQE